MKPFVTAIFVLCLFSGSLRAQDHFQPSPVATTVPDLQVVTQTGEHLRFNSQVVKGRIAIVTGFFTTCSSMCPITQEKLSDVAKVLGPRLGKDVVIVSLSTDADRDTLERMKAWREKFNIGRGWILAAGDKTKLDELLKALGLFVDVPQRHQSALMIGNDESGWFRISSWAPTEKLVKLVDTLVARKNAGGAVPPRADLRHFQFSTRESLAIADTGYSVSGNKMKSGAPIFEQNLQFSVCIYERSMRKLLQPATAGVIHS